jgi:hypothetical protein
VSDPALTDVLLSVVTGCGVALTVVMAITAGQLMRTLRRIVAVLPEAQDTLREARQCLQQARRLLTHGEQATRHVEAVVHHACAATSDVIDGLVRLKDTAEHLLAGRFGNGARAEPRRRHRRMA